MAAANEMNLCEEVQGKCENMLPSLQYDSVLQFSKMQHPRTKQLSGKMRGRNRSHRARTSRQKRMNNAKSLVEVHNKNPVQPSREEVVYEEDFLFDTSMNNREDNLAEGGIAEDGEILEDGEIASDDGEQKSSSISITAHAEGEGSCIEPATDARVTEKCSTIKRNNNRKRKDGWRSKNDLRKRSCRFAYFDHDRMDEDGVCQSREHDVSMDDNSYFVKSGRHREGTFNSFLFKGGVENLPGLYDSPSDDSEKEQGAQESLSLASLVSDDFLDAGVAVKEKQFSTKGSKAGPRERKRIRSKRKLDIGPKPSDLHKKRLTEIPMADRPVCKFYKDGKCAKMLHPIVVKDEISDKQKKPSLLGSPPRHLKEAAERTRKIPSLFDIEVFPPTKSTGFYSERTDHGHDSSPSSSPPPPMEFTFKKGFTGPASQSGLLGSPPRSHGGRIMNGFQVPMQHPMMMQSDILENHDSANCVAGNQALTSAVLQDGMNHGISQHALHLNMQPGLQQGMQPGLQQGMQPAMCNNGQHGLNQNLLQQGLSAQQRAVNPIGQQHGVGFNMPPGVDSSSSSGLSQQRFNFSMQQQPALNIRMPRQPPAMTFNLQSGLSQNVQQGLNVSMQPLGLNVNMPQCINLGSLQPEPSIVFNINNNANMPPQQRSQLQAMIMQNMRGINPNVSMMMNSGMLASRFGICRPAASTMPPVLNMINALIHGGAVGRGVQQQNCFPQHRPVINHRSGGLTVGECPVPTSSEGNGRPGQISEPGSIADDANFSASLNPNLDFTSTRSDIPQAVNVDGWSEINCPKEVVSSHLDLSACPKSEWCSVVTPDPVKQATEERSDNGGWLAGSATAAAVVEDNVGGGFNQPLPATSVQDENGNGMSCSGGGNVKVSRSGTEDSALMRLPPTQRQLFLRIQQQQLHEHHHQSVSADEDRLNSSLSADECKPTGAKSCDDVDNDDNWYSSDEDGSGISKKQLSDILKNISKVSTAAIDDHDKQPCTSSPVCPAFSTTSTLDVMQMIQSIRTQAHTCLTTSATELVDRCHRHERCDIHRASLSEHASLVTAPPAGNVGRLAADVPRAEPPETSAVLRKSIDYRLQCLSLRPVKPYWTLPSCVDPLSIDRRRDPRVRAHVTLVERFGAEGSCASGAASPKPGDLCSAHCLGNEQARGTVSDSSVHRHNDPRKHSVRQLDPRLLNKLHPESVTSVTAHSDLHVPGTGDSVTDRECIKNHDARAFGPSGFNPQMPWMHDLDGQTPSSFHGNPMFNPRAVMQVQNETWNGVMPIRGPINTQHRPMSLHPNAMHPMQRAPCMSGRCVIGAMSVPGLPAGMHSGSVRGYQTPICDSGFRRGHVNMRGASMSLQPRSVGMIGHSDVRMMQQGRIRMVNVGGMGIGQVGPADGTVHQNVLQAGTLSVQHLASIHAGTVRGLAGGGSVEEVSVESGSVSQPGCVPGKQPDNSTSGISSEPYTGIMTSNSTPVLSTQFNSVGEKFPHLEEKSPISVVSTCCTDSKTLTTVCGDSFHHEGELHKENSLKSLPDGLVKDTEMSLPSPLREPPLQITPKEQVVSKEASRADEYLPTKKHFNHRNDPRFKRKRVSDSKLVEDGDCSKKTAGLMGQRKSTMQYTSPLGGNDDDSQSSTNYNSYNQPHSRTDPRKKSVPVCTEKTFRSPQMELPLLSLSQQSPPTSDLGPPELFPEQPQTQLRDLFKKIDPTASPFC